MFLKYVDKIQGSLKYGTNNTYFIQRPMHIYGNISLSSSSNKKCLQQKL